MNEDQELPARALGMTRPDPSPAGAPGSVRRWTRSRGAFAVVCGLVYGAILLALVWSRSFDPALLLAGGIAAIAAGAWIWRSGGGVAGMTAPRALVAAALAFATLSLGAVVLTGARLDRLAAGWDDLTAARRARITRDLDRRTALFLERGRQAAGRAAAEIGGAPATDERRLFAIVDGIRARTGVDALAVYSETGELVAWAGDHRGPVPEQARAPGTRTAFVERPLFSYVYFAAPVEGRGERVVAAMLLQTGLISGTGGPEGFTDRFAARTGARPEFAAGVGPAGTWPLVAGGDTIAHAQFEPITQAEWRGRVGDAGRRIILSLSAVVLLLLTVAWRRAGLTAGIGGMAPLLAVTVAAAWAPLGPALGMERLFAPAIFLLPMPPELSLGRLLVLLVPLAALASAMHPAMLDPRAGRLALAPGSLAVALAFPAALRLLIVGAAPGLPDEGAAYWGAFQIAALLILTTVAGLALPEARPAGGGAGRPGGVGFRPARPLLIAAGVVSSLALTGAVLARWRMAQSIDVWLPALWAVPFGLLGLGMMGYAGRAGRLLRWLVAGWLAATAVLPHLWVTQVDARLDAAERDLATLGLRPDPFLDYLLHQFAAEVERRHARGEDGVTLLYRAWVASGLAREAYPARVALWDGADRSEAELPLGESLAARRGGLPATDGLRRGIARARTVGRPVVEPAPGAPGVSQLLAIPLEGGRVVTVFVPPRRSLERSTILAPILGTEPNPANRLTLVPEVGGSAGPGAARPRWTPTDQGWRSEALLRYPDGEYHAHLELRTPAPGVLFARGVLLIALDLGLLALLWVLGRAMRGDPPAPTGGWAAWAGTFRFRVTLALFGFFLLPTIIFGTLAYRALAGEAARTARVVAERAAAQAVAAFSDLPGNWRALSTRVGEEVLYYHRGELAQAASPEAIALGVFGAWMPPSVYLTLGTGEEASAVEGRRLGRRPYLVAYRRLPAGTLAVPVSVVAGESSIRQRELADLVLFAVLIGAALSLALSLAVGRALARPLGQLRRASAAVGAGRLRVRLPGTGAGEFGELFASFNRMVRRLRRARARELRAARVLAWGEMSRQVAHEIKNPLTPIKLSVQHLRRAYADRRPDFDEILDSNVAQILTEIDRLTEIARAFSRYGAPAEAAGPLEPVDVAAVVQEALTLYRASEAGIHYWPDLEPFIPPVRARASELKEVLLNLLENAHAALEGNGTVVVSAHREGEVVELCVRDDGPGIAPELLTRIFEPHFSTRSAGTGLGLAIVRRLVEDWGGSIAAESEPGRGTAIRIRLPIDDARRPSRPVTAGSGS